MANLKEMYIKNGFYLKLFRVFAESKFRSLQARRCCAARVPAENWPARGGSNAGVSGRVGAFFAGRCGTPDWCRATENQDDALCRLPRPGCQ